MVEGAVFGHDVVEQAQDGLHVVEVRDGVDAFGAGGPALRPPSSQT